MTDSQPSTGPTGVGPDGYVPSGARRSTYTPPPEGAQPPTFDDDALADALAAQVASYTAPVPVITPDEERATAVSEPAAPASREPVAEPAAEPEAPAPAAPASVAPPPFPVAPPPFPVAPPPFPTAPPPAAEAPEPTTAPEPEPEPAEPAAVEAAMSPTLEAIERLENELRRRAEEARGAVAPAEAAPVAPANVEPDAAPGFAPPTGPAFAPPAGSAFPPPPADDVDSRPAPTAWDLSSHEDAAAPVPPPAAPPSPPPLVEPPAGFAQPPATPPVDLPPPAEASPATGSVPVDAPPPTGAPVDFSQLPPPVGLEPAALPPYDPDADTASVVPAPPAADPADLVAPPHPDDLGAGGFAPWLPPAPEPDAPGAPASDLPEPGAPASDGEVDDDDVVDEIDRVFGTGAIAVDSTGSVAVVGPPSEPVRTPRLAEDEPGLVDESAESHPALLVESAGPEPTPLDLRAGRAARLFWLNFAANSSVLSMALGAVLFGLGTSLRQAIIAIVLGVALSFLPLGLVTLAGKWSGQPTAIVSRAMFGVVGNVLPAALAIVSRVFWGGALLWVLATGVGQVLDDAGLDAGLGPDVWTYVALGAGFALALLVAVFGYGLVARVQLVLSIATGLLVVGVVAITWPRLDLAAAQSVPDGPWSLLVAGTVLVFSFVGLAWVHSSGDLARYQRPGGDGGASMLWATFGATIPAFVLIAWGALLAASDPLIADGLATNPLHTIAALLPIWYPAPLLAIMGLGLLSGAVLTIYSGGFALQALGVGLRRSATTAIAGALVLAAAVALVLLAVDAQGLVRDAVTTLAVPVAAWAGIFAAELMLRRRRLHAPSLLHRGGVYPDVRWVNLVGLVVISALGFGLTTAHAPGLAWQGYLLPFLGLGDDPLASSDVGVLVALLLGVLLPLATAVPAIRRQERALVD